MKNFLLARSARLLVLLSLGWLPVTAADFQDHAIVIEKELLITAPEVVDAAEARYPGAWSFGHLVEQAFGREEASVKVEQWLQLWAGGQVAAGGKVPIHSRSGLREALILPWQKRDGYREDSGEAWKPQWRNAPFRLLAIVNRMDLALPEFTAVPSSRGYNSGGASLATRENGEARLIFCLVDEQGKPFEKGLTLIFEYGLDGNNEAARLDWAMAWHALGKRKEFDQGYRDELQQLTRCFTDRGVEKVAGAEEKKPQTVIEHLMAKMTKERMPLLRVRSNDGVGGALREFREFEYVGNEFRAAVLKSSPREEFFERNNSVNRHLVKWLESDAQKAQIEWLEAVRLNRDPSITPEKRTVVLPEQILVSRVMTPVSGFVSVAKDETAHWDGRGMSDDRLRREISLQSCCGCHCGDTNTSFYHIAPRAEGEAAKLSTFLRTDGRNWSLTDPATKQRLRSAEMEDRRDFFASLLDPDLSVREKRKLRDARKLLVH